MTAYTRSTWLERSTRRSQPPFGASGGISFAAAEATYRARGANKRLKLAGVIALMETECGARDGARTVVPHPCAGGRVARSLSAIR